MFSSWPFFVSGSENEVDYSQEVRCEHFKLDLLDYFSLAMERVNLKYGNCLPRHSERLTTHQTYVQKLL